MRSRECVVPPLHVAILICSGLRKKKKPFGRWKEHADILDDGIIETAVNPFFRNYLDLKSVSPW